MCTLGVSGGRRGELYIRPIVFAQPALSFSITSSLSPWQHVYQDTLLFKATDASYIHVNPKHISRTIAQ